MADYESVLCVKNEVFVYRIPARTSNRGYRAAEWKLDEPDWTGRLKVVAKGRDLTVRLEDKNSGELFAQCPVESYPSAAVEQVLDSSRYFVLRIQDVSGRAAFIGLGFADRGDSFDLLVSLQDHFKQIKREATVQEQSDHGSAAAFDAGPKLDLGFKEGQTITISMPSQKSGESATPGSSVKQRPRGAAGTSALLPPPPGAGTRVAAISKPAAQSATLAAFDFDTPNSGAASTGSSWVTSPPSTGHGGGAGGGGSGGAGIGSGGGGSGVDLLLDLGSAPAQSSLTTQQQTTGMFGSNWNDFSSAPVAGPAHSAVMMTAQPTKPQQPCHGDINWVNFD